MYETVYAVKESSKTKECQSIQMKIFIDKDPEQVAHQVNHWIAEHPVAVQHVCQSQSEKGGKFLFIVSLFYNNKH